jgi:hypothetical protein
LFERPNAAAKQIKAQRDKSAPKPHLAYIDHRPCPILAGWAMHLIKQIKMYALAFQAKQ